MPIRRLQTAEDVVKAIGRDRLYELTGKKTNNVTNWLACGHFPPELHELMTDELRTLGCSAPGSLWRQQQRRHLQRAQKKRAA